jgi:endogenous inhibitor of DNA gyrase (YacG/DUF329 family)
MKKEKEECPLCESEVVSEEQVECPLCQSNVPSKELLSSRYGLQDWELEERFLDRKKVVEMIEISKTLKDIRDILKSGIR